MIQLSTALYLIVTLCFLIWTTADLLGFTYGSFDILKGRGRLSKYGKGGIVLYVFMTLIFAIFFWI